MTVPGRTNAPKFYGLLSNGTTAALVGPDASVDFLPFPRFDSRTVFTRLLGTDHEGFFQIAPDAATHADVSQRYIPGTNILLTEFQTPQGRARVIDYLAVGRTELCRVVSSTIPVWMTVRPVFQYGLVTAVERPQDLGAVFDDPLSGAALHLRLAILGPGGRVQSLDPGRFEQQAKSDPRTGTWHLMPGRYVVTLSYVADDGRKGHVAPDVMQAPASLVDPDAFTEGRRPLHSLFRHIRLWRQMPRAPYDGPYQDAVDRSILVLRALTYRTNGTILAAPTTSLPETVGESRQWDYRFAWIRDASFAAEALLEADDPVAARRVIEFFLNCMELEGKPFAAPFFHVDGTLIRGERELGWLPGYRDSRPCREGNAATGQVQLDVEGDFLWVLYRYYALTGDQVFVRAYWEQVAGLANWTAANWTMQDASLWEFRGQDADYTHSKLMCWTALHYAGELARAIGEHACAVRWEREAEAVRAAIQAHAIVPKEGRYGQAFGTDRTDAALLLFPLYGFCPVDDPVFLATLAAIERDLLKDDWVYRYNGDMLGDAAHPFLIASSWLSRVYSRLGRTDRAQAVLERLLEGRTDLGLLGEHVDMETGEPRGNFPQAFSHLGIVMAALELERAKTSGKPSAPAALRVQDTK